MTEELLSLPVPHVPAGDRGVAWLRANPPPDLALMDVQLADGREFAFGGIFDLEELGLKPGGGGFSQLCQTIKRYRADTLVLSGPLDDEALALVIEAAGSAGCQLYALPRAFALGGVVILALAVLTLATFIALC